MPASRSFEDTFFSDCGFLIFWAVEIGVPQYILFSSRERSQRMSSLRGAGGQGVWKKDESLFSYNICLGFWLKKDGEEKGVKSAKFQSPISQKVFKLQSSNGMHWKAEMISFLVIIM